LRIKLRTGTSEDAQDCGEICYRAFRVIAEKHNFPPDFPSPGIATTFLSEFLAHPNIYGVVAELDGRIVGSNFVDERSIIAGVGPITVDPSVQDRAIGRELMQHVMNRVAVRRFPGVRLVQAAYHNRSLSLYTKLGFAAREPLSTIQGKAILSHIPGYIVRPATIGDLSACNQLCMRVHGHDRRGELHDAIKRGVARVVEHNDHITGYATTIGYLGHAVSETNEGSKALISEASEFWGPGFLLPTRNAEIFRWCLEQGLRVIQPMTLMSIGLYNEPAGAFLASVLY
jgi:predicted N-acetyltransferase YhbS